LLTLFVGWLTGAVILPPGDVIFALLACPLNDVIFGLHQEQQTYLSTNIKTGYLGPILLNF